MALRRRCRSGSGAEGEDEAVAHRRRRIGRRRGGGRRGGRGRGAGGLGVVPARRRAGTLRAFRIAAATGKTVAAAGPWTFLTTSLGRAFVLGPDGAAGDGPDPLAPDALERILADPDPARLEALPDPPRAAAGRWLNPAAGPGHPLPVMQVACLAAGLPRAAAAAGGADGAEEGGGGVLFVTAECCLRGGESSR